ncbi:MAG: hypothetical protein HC813_03500, partial [Planctomycetes bacterium]|nr:hypothetical protein [Planctomycetota bacterium]
MIALLEAEIAARPERLLFAALAGDHLYGMEAAEGDFDVRACHLLPASDLLGLRAPVESIACTVQREGLAYEYLSHDLKKFALLLLKKNGNVLEHICSPTSSTQHPPTRSSARSPSPAPAATWRRTTRAMRACSGRWPSRGTSPP